MVKVTVMFQKMVQDTQDYQSFDKNEDHMVSTLFFSLETGRKRYGDLRVEVRQPYGTPFESEPLEVAKPVGTYPGLWNHAAFRDLCEEYYRKLVGAKGSGIRIEGGQNIRMRNNTFILPWSGEFEAPESSGLSW